MPYSDSQLIKSCLWVYFPYIFQRSMLNYFLITSANTIYNVVKMGQSALCPARSYRDGKWPPTTAPFWFAKLAWIWGIWFLSIVPESDTISRGPSILVRYELFANRREQCNTEPTADMMDTALRWLDFASESKEAIMSWLGWSRTLYVWA